MNYREMLNKYERTLGRRKQVMVTYTLVGRIPLGYNDFGSMALTEVGLEKLDELIAARLPEDVARCGNELIAPIDFDGDIDVKEIVDAARDEIFECYQDEEYWEPDD